jgi:hypothetical protein
MRILLCEKRAHTAILMKIQFFWDMMPYQLVNVSTIYQLMQHYTPGGLNFHEFFSLK